jgi:hypothetical protein
MKKARLLLPLILLLVVPMTAQIEHAPTPAQCRADANAWGVPNANPPYQNDEQIAEYATRIMRDPNVTARDLDARNKELNLCVKTDKGILAPPSEWYTQASRAYALAELGRMANFMQRHSLTGQFYQEDEQGKR